MKAVSELVKGVEYKIYSNGGCKEMETTVFRTFYGVNDKSEVLFNDDSMGCPIIYDTRYWTFYSVA